MPPNQSLMRFYLTNAKYVPRQLTRIWNRANVYLPNMFNKPKRM